MQKQRNNGTTTNQIKRILIIGDTTSLVKTTTRIKEMNGNDLCDSMQKVPEKEKTRNRDEAILLF